jgi:hypothetical protein
MFVDVFELALHVLEKKTNDSGFSSSLLKKSFSKAAKKCPCLPAGRQMQGQKSSGMRRTWMYAAMTKNEDNAIDGRFSAA